MRGLRTLLLLLAALALATALAAQDDGPSLGDVARKARLQKQKEAQAQAKDAQPNGATTAKDSSDSPASKVPSGKDTSAKDSTAKGPRKVVTNDEIPEHVGPTSTLPAIVKAPGAPEMPPNYDPNKVPAEYWKNQIMALKASISALESEIQDVTDSIRYAGGTCAVNCVQWNERQQQKEQQVQMMTSQLTQQQKSLDALQETARKQGYSSAVYDP